MRHGYIDYEFSKNIFGDVVAIISGGLEVARYEYDAWGNHKVYNLDGTENTDEDFIGNINPIRYHGYYYDRESGMYYLQTRYYDPEIGQFISPDSPKYLDPQTIDGFNLYAYCNYNPIMYSDPTGQFVLSAFVIGMAIILGASAITGAVIGGVSAYAHNEGVGDGILKGAGIGALFGLSIISITIGVGTPLAASIWGSIAIGAGVGSAFALGANLSSQLQHGGFGSIDMKSASASWGIGLGVGALAGATSYALYELFAYYGGIFGLSLAETYIGDRIIGSIIAKDFLFEVGGLLAGALGGFIGGNLVNNLATFWGFQDQNIPLWLVTLLKFLK